MSDELKNAPPQNLEAEQMVLGAVLIENGSLTGIADILRPGDFYREAHSRIFEAMLGMKDKGEAIDLVTLTAAMQGTDTLSKVGGAAYLSTLVSLVPTAANAAYHARIVARASLLRQADRLLAEARGAVQENVEPDTLITAVVGKLNDLRRFEARRIVASRDLMKAGFSEIERRFDLARRGEIAGIPTGFRDLDRKLFGFQPQFYVLAGGSGMGKSALADQFVRSAAGHFAAKKQGESAGIISLEMGEQQLALRTIASLSQVPLSRLLAGTIHDRDWEILAQAASEASRLPVHYEFTSFSDREQERTIDYLVQVLGVRFLVFDYLQLGRVEDHQGTREQEVTKISRLLKRKVKQHRIPIIVLSSLNKGLNARPDKRPQNSDLRESGNIEFDADVIMFVYREEMYHKCECPKPPIGACSCGRRGKAEVIISKGRMEGLGTVDLEWQTNITSFRDVAEAVQQ